MIKQTLRTRIPAISAAVGLLWSLSLASGELTNSQVSFGLAVAVAVATVVRPRIEVMGVALAATLALASITATTESFAVAGGSFVTCLGAMAVVERRLRLSVFGFAVASVAAVAIAAPLIVENTIVAEAAFPLSQSATSEVESLTPPFQNDFDVVLPPLDMTELLITPSPARGEWEQELERGIIAESIRVDRLTSEGYEPSISGQGRDGAEAADDSVWIQILLGLALLWVIRRSVVELPGLPDQQEQGPPPTNDEYVERLDAAGMHIGIARNGNESILAYGARLSMTSGDDEFAEVAELISERLYGKSESVDISEIQSLLDRLDARTPPGGQPT